MAKLETITANPNWSQAQRKYFAVLQKAIPIAMSYCGEEIPIMDNHSDSQVIDETGVLKQVKKFFEKPEKAHVERLKARIGALETGKFAYGHEYVASFRGAERIILNQEACKELIEVCDKEGIHLNRLLAAIKSGQVKLPENVFLQDSTVDTPAESNRPDFFTVAAGGRSLYVEVI